MKTVRILATSVGGLALCVTLIGSLGCGSAKDIEIPQDLNSLRNLVSAYRHATASLGRPPKTELEAMPFLTKLGDPKAILSSPNDGTPLIIQWGGDIQKQQDGHFLVWAYEKSSHGGKRWVLLGRQPMQMTDDELRSAPFAPGLKKPI